MAASSAQPPEVAGQPKIGEQRLGLIDRVAPPVRIELPRVPSPRELPSGLKRQSPRARETARLAPVTRMFLRPEEQHRRSGEDDVLPPFASRKGELHDDSVER